MISIIVPVFNVDKFLSTCLDSIINQTFKNIEVILVDDGSTDDSGNICDHYSALDERVKVFHISNSGVSHARNFALDKAKGDWVTFVDGDDWIEPNMIEELYKVAFDNKCDIVMSNFYMEHSSYNEITHSTPGFITKKDFPTFPLSIIVENCASGDNINVKVEVLCGACAKLTKMSLLKSNNIKFSENLKLNEDGLFYLTCYFYAHELAIINRSFYHYRIHTSSSNYRFRPDIHTQMIQWKNEFEKMGSMISSNMLQDYLSLNAYRRYLAISYLYISHRDNDKSFFKRLLSLRSLISTNVYNVISIPKGLPWFKIIEMFLLKYKIVVLLFLISEIRNYTKSRKC